MRIWLLLVACACVLASSAAGQRIKVHGPTLGFVFDRSGRALLPIDGIPGAAEIGEPIELSGTPTRMMVAPGAAHAVADMEGNPLAVLLRNGHGAPIPLPGTRTAANIIAFSASGDAVALYHSDSSSVFVVRGLPDSPEEAEEWPLSGLPGSISALAVGDGGGMALVGIASEVDGGIYLLRAGGAAHRIGSLSDPRLIAVNPGATEAIAVDAAANSIHRFSDLQRTAAEFVVPGPSGSDSPITAVAYWSGGGHLLAARQDGSITLFAASGEELSSASCECIPDGLVRTAVAGVFQVLRSDGRTSLLVETSPGTLELLFVPDRRRQE